MPPKKTSKKQAKTKSKRALKPVRRRARRQRRRIPDELVAFATEPGRPINEPRIPRLELREFFGAEVNGTVAPVSENTVDNILKNDPRVQRLIVCEGRRVYVLKEPLEKIKARLKQVGGRWRTRPAPKMFEGSGRPGSKIQRRIVPGGRDWKGLERGDTCPQIITADAEGLEVGHCSSDAEALEELKPREIESGIRDRAEELLKKPIAHLTDQLQREFEGLTSEAARRLLSEALSSRK